MQPIKKLKVRPTYAEIDLSAIAFNINQIKKKVATAQIMAIVKANAYGHGMVEVAQTALDNGATYLGVALVEEGIELREHGLTSPILVFDGAFVEQIAEFLRHDLELTLYSLTLARAVSREAFRRAQKARVHIKVDTGMGRVGVEWQKAADLVYQVSQMPGIELVGLYTHFATSEERDKTYARLQLDRFKMVIQQIEALGIKIPLKHAANSGAILDLPESYFDLVRPGIMMYGWYPSRETSESIPIRPAMSLKSRVLFVKEVPEGTSVSYGREYVTHQKTRLATIPVGYADGYNRLLTNQGEVLIRGRKYPVVGRVCMDQIIIDLGEGSDVQEGDEVVLYGKQGEAEVSVYDICNKLGTIPYEVCCWISSRVPRVFIGETGS